MLPLEAMTPPWLLVTLALVALKLPAAPMKPAWLIRSPVCSVMPPWLKMPLSVPELVLLKAAPWVLSTMALPDWIKPALLISAPLVLLKPAVADSVPPVLLSAPVPAAITTPWPDTVPPVLFNPWLVMLKSLPDCSAPALLSTAPADVTSTVLSLDVTNPL